MIVAVKTSNGLPRARALTPILARLAPEMRGYLSGIRPVQAPASAPLIDPALEQWAVHIAKVSRAFGMSMEEAAHALRILACTTR